MSTQLASSLYSCPMRAKLFHYPHLFVGVDCLLNIMGDEAVVLLAKSRRTYFLRQTLRRFLGAIC